MIKAQILSRSLPSIPFRLVVDCYVCDAEWIVDRHRGDWRFAPPRIIFHPMAPADAEEYLSALMNVRTIQDVQVFLSRYGNPFPYLPSENHPPVKQRITLMAGLEKKYWDMPPLRSSFYWKELLSLQRALQELAQSEKPELPKKLSGLSVELIVSDGKLIAECHEMSGARACFAQLCFAKLRETTFNWCARADCGRFFAHTNRHAKKYCSPECAHLVAVRNSRRKKEVR